MITNGDQERRDFSISSSHKSIIFLVCHSIPHYICVKMFKEVPEYAEMRRDIIASL